MGAAGVSTICYRTRRTRRGMLSRGLGDPRTSLIEDLHGKGSPVFAYSTCSGDQKEGSPVTLVVGWPRPVSDGVEVRADRLCGWECARGFRVHVKNTDAGWRAIGAY